jgi:hypothetical protein
MKIVSAAGTITPSRTDVPSALAYWHLLSLDAPTVATSWTIFIAHTTHVFLPACVPCAKFLAVWAVYACDRLMDARRQEQLEARHRFHGEHRKSFRAAVTLAIVALLPLIEAIPSPLRKAYLVLGGLLLLWLVMIHYAGALRRIPKEIAVGFFFSAAIFIPVLSRATLAHLVLPALLFANLCSLNCLFIYAWEHPRSAGRPHGTTSFGLRHLDGIALASIFVPLVAMAFAGVPLILFAVSLSAATLLLLHRNRARFDRITLRAAADLALLSPLVLLPFVR